MCNHVGGDGANASWLPADDGAVELRRIVQTRSRTPEQTEDEVEVTISYGDKTGKRFDEAQLMLPNLRALHGGARVNAAWLCVELR